MAYSINPNLPKARAIALKLLILEKLPLQVVANRCGVHRSTIYRWRLKWDKLNEDVQLDNLNRPHRELGSKFRFAALKWLIPTLSSKPSSSPNAIPANIVDLVLTLRRMLKRCAEAIWFHLVNDNGVSISLSSVRRILKRHHEINGRRKKVRRDNPRRPVVTKPGELVQTDTVHYVDLATKQRRYIYYHCTQFRYKHKAKYYREELIEEYILNSFSGFKLSENDYKRVLQEIKKAQKDKSKYKLNNENQLNAELKKYENRINKLYDDKLDGNIDKVFFDTKYNSYKESRDAIYQKLQAIGNAEDQFYANVENIVNILQNAPEKLKSSKYDAKRRIINLVLQNLRLDDKELRWEYKKPFDYLHQTAFSSNWLALADELRTASVEFDEHDVSKIKEMLVTV